MDLLGEGLTYKAYQAGSNGDLVDMSNWTP